VTISRGGFKTEDRAQELLTVLQSVPKFTPYETLGVDLAVRILGALIYPASIAV
jgi:hypothetical protein